MKILLLGCGNMTQALFSHPLCGVEYFTYTPSMASAEKLAKRLKGKVVREPKNCIADIDILFLGMKPQQFGDAVKALGEFSGAVYSILAGVPLHRLEVNFPKASFLIRMMPNTPSLVGRGCNTFVCSLRGREEQLAMFKKFFSISGELIELETEEQLDYATPINGSSPAYVFEFTRIMQKILEQKLPETLARKIAVQSVLGAAELMQAQEELTLEELREKVTSHKGVTFEALEVFKERNLQEIVEQAVEKAYQRTLELRA